ncbi:MAG: heme lyase CcmF/NrfE family subunit, partial [Actinomycetota bacterium]
AFVVLLGTTFPLLLEAVNGTQVTVGAPYFNAFIGPLGIAILFFMGVAPLLPWQRTNRSLVQRRLLWPAVAAAATVVVEILARVQSPGLIFAYPMAVFAAGAALRQAAVHTMYSRKRKRGILRLLFSRTNGGMLVHIAVAIIALALVSSTSYGQRTSLVLKPGQSASFDGHEFTYHGVQTVVTPAKTSLEALISVDGSASYTPEVSQFGNNSEVVGTPSVRPGLVDDVYLTLDLPPQNSSGSATFGVVIQPLVSWIWIAGGLMAAGSAIAAFGTKDISPLETVEEEFALKREDPDPEIPVAP